MTAPPPPDDNEAGLDIGLMMPMLKNDEMCIQVGPGMEGRPQFFSGGVSCPASIIKQPQTGRECFDPSVSLGQIPYTLNGRTAVSQIYRQIITQSLLIAHNQT